MSSIFFSGDAQEAIHRSKAEGKPLIVFLKGNNSASAATEAHLESRSLSDVLSGCYVLRLNDDLEDHESQEYKTARMFRAYFPTDELPTIMLMGRNGHALMALKGDINSQELDSQLQEAVAAFHLQGPSRKVVESAVEAPPRGPSEKLETPGAQGPKGEESGLCAPQPPSDPADPPPQPAEMTSARIGHDESVKSRGGVVHTAPGMHSSEARDMRSAPTTGLQQSEQLRSNAEGSDVQPRECPTSTSNVQRNVSTHSVEGTSTSETGGGDERKTEESVVRAISVGSGHPANGEDGSAPAAESSSPVGALEVEADTVEHGAESRHEVADERRAVCPPSISNHLERMGKPSINMEASDGYMTRQNDARPSAASGGQADAPSPKQTKTGTKTQPRYTSASLRFRLTDGESMEAKFSADTTLSEVRQFVDLHRTDGKSPYNFGTVYPMRTFDSQHNGKTLEELDLVPRSTVLLQPIRKQAPAAGSMAAAPAQWGLLGLWGVIWRLMTTLWELFWPSTKRPEKEREDYNSEEAAGTKTPKDDWKHSTPETARGNGRGNGGALLAQLIDSVTCRKGYGPNVHGLSDTPDADPSSNAYWNGNSTQYGGSDDE